METRPGTKLEPPTRTSALESLRRVLGEDAFDVWASASAEAGVAWRPDLTPEQICAVARVLAKRPGLVGTLGVSLRVRCETYLALQRGVG